MPHIRGFYNPKTRVVSVVLRTHHGLTPEYVLAHEYVHHLQYNRQMPMKLPRAHIRGHEKDYKAMKRMDADDREIVAIIMGSALVRQYHREVR